MTIPQEHLKDVLEDLSALYLSGEATAGTRAVVEAHAQADREFGERLKASGGIGLPLPPAVVEADAEMRALKETRQFLTLRSVFMAMGIAFTLLPLSFGSLGSDGRGVRMLFLYDQPGIVYSSWSVAAASWVAMWVMHRAIGKKGL
jgi:hypothetical protein